MWKPYLTRQGDSYALLGRLPHLWEVTSRGEVSYILLIAL